MIFSLWGNRATTHTHMIFCTVFFPIFSALCTSIIENNSMCSMYVDLHGSFIIGSELIGSYFNKRFDLERFKFVVCSQTQFFFFLFIIWHLGLLEYNKITLPFQYFVCTYTDQVRITFSFFFKRHFQISNCDSSHIQLYSACVLIYPIA